MRGVRFRLLGPVTAVVDGHAHSLPRAQTRGLLAYLLLNAGRPVSREALTDALWGGVGRQALALLEEFPTRDGHALTWDTVGRAHEGLGEYDEAIECYQKALAIHADIPYPVHEGETWSNLGDAYRASGRLAEARAAWLRSLEILAPDHPVIPRVEANLAALVQVHDRA